MKGKGWPEIEPLEKKIGDPGEIFHFGPTTVYITWQNDIFEQHSGVFRVLAPTYGATFFFSVGPRKVAFRSKQNIRVRY